MATQIIASRTRASRTAKAIPQVQFYKDPLREAAEWAANRYHLGTIKIVFYKKLRVRDWIILGCTPLSSRSPRLIGLSIRQTHWVMIETLLHELAHIVADKRYGIGGNHGPIFKKTLSEITADWRAVARRDTSRFRGGVFTSEPEWIYHARRAVQQNGRA